MAALKLQTTDVVIVGAGLSGLRAATEIADSGLSYVLLEAMDHVGGKTLSLPTNNSTGLIEMGAAWINDSNQSEMYSLARDFDFNLVIQRCEGNSLVESRSGEIASVPFGAPGLFTPEELVQIHDIMQKIKEYVDRSDLEQPHLGPDAEYLDSLTASEWLDTEFGSEVSDTLIKILTRNLLGVDPHELSALFLVDYIKSGTGLENMISDLKDGAQYLRNIQGNQNFSTQLAARLMPGSIKLLAPVKTITQSDDGCIVETNDGVQYSSKRVIVSVPTTLYRLIEFIPALPPSKRLLQESTKMGYYSKTVLVFSEPWWRSANLSGVFTSDNGPISFTRDTCVPETGLFSITCFHVGEPGRRWSTLSAEARQDAVLKQFRSAFSSVVDSVPEPINIVEKEWSKDPWARGAPNPVMMPGLMTSEAGQSIREPFGNVHFIGTETSLVWKGYMEGAVRSGVRGAKEVITALKS